MIRIWITLLIIISIIFNSGCSRIEKKDSEIKVCVISSLINEKIIDSKHNRDIHIIEVDVKSDHERIINNTICEHYIEEYNNYLKKGEYDFPYLLIDTVYSIKDNVLSITVVSRYSATDIPSSYGRYICFDIEKDMLYTVEEYIDIAEIDIDIAEDMVKTAILNDNFTEFDFEINNIYYNDEDERVLVANMENTNKDSHDISSVYLINYDSMKYVATYNDYRFNGFDDIVWSDINWQPGVE